MYSSAGCAPPTPHVSRYWIPAGPLGIELTVVHMRREVRAALGDPLLEGTARAIVGGASPRSAAARIRAFLDDRTRFVPDPLGVELIRSPVFMLETIECAGYAVGDCDDIAVLGAALGLSAGIPARFVLLAFEDPGLYEHVYTELLTPEPVELDTTRPAQLPPDFRIARQGTRRV